MTHPDPTDLPPASPRGGKRPGSGRRKLIEKAFTMSVTFSRKSAADKLKKLAKDASLTTGALIEKRFKLRPRRKKVI